MLLSTTNNNTAATIECFKIFVAQIIEMHDGVSNNPRSKKLKRNSKIAAIVTTSIVFLIACLATGIQTYSAVNRYMKHEVQQVITTVQNDSLMLPVGKTKFDNW